MFESLLIILYVCIDASSCPALAYDTCMFVMNSMWIAAGAYVFLWIIGLIVAQIYDFSYQSSESD